MRGKDTFQADKLYERTLLERVGWLIKLRWIAVLGLALTAVLADRIFPIRLHRIAKTSLVGFAIFLGLYNLLLYLRLKWIKKREDPDLITTCPYRLTIIQITIDLIVLTIVLDLAGGILNPLSLFMVFHIAIAGSILPRGKAFNVAIFASLLLLIMGLIGKFFPALRVPLDGYPLEEETPPLAENSFYIFSVWLSHTIAFLLIAYFTTQISSELRDVLIRLEIANESLLEQDKKKTRFLRTVAHQLKSPLATIITMVNALFSTKEESEFDPQTYQTLEKIHQRSKYMLELVDDLLRLTQIKEGIEPPQEKQNIKIGSIIVDTAKLFADEANQKGIEVELYVDDLDTSVFASERDIQDIATNLISNAIKYTEKGKVIIEGKKKGKKYLFRVKDTGIGIPEDEQSHLFEEFFRASNAREKALHSSGLGLSITAAIVKKLGGNISFKSKEGMGTEFTVELPIAK